MSLAVLGGAFLWVANAALSYLTAWLQAVFLPATRAARGSSVCLSLRFSDVLEWLVRHR